MKSATMPSMDDINLDGIYQVSSATNYDGPLERKSDGLTEIRGGKTSRQDNNGVLWTSTFRVLNDQQVEMVSVADPSKARNGYGLRRPDGSPTLESVTYTSLLKLARKGDKIQMSGQIHHGNEIIFLTMRKVKD